MRVLVIADIHANWPALQAVATERFDVCVCLGDLVDYGVEPGLCIDWVSRHCRHVIRGNHDHSFLQQLPTGANTGLRYLANVTRTMMDGQLTVEQRQFLATRPLTEYLRIDHLSAMLVHATPRDPLDEYVFEQEAAWRKRLEGLDVDLVCVGHTHHPFVMKLDGVTVLNPGSVGQPRDGDPRASYAVIDGGEIELKRIDYDIEAAVRSIDRSGLPVELRELAANMLRTGGMMTEPQPELANGRDGASDQPQS